MEILRAVIRTVLVLVMTVHPVIFCGVLESAEISRGVDGKYEIKEPPFYWKPMVLEERDMLYYPYRAIRLIGVEEGDVIADVDAGAGYWTAPLARAAGPEGKVIAINPKLAGKGPGEMEAYLEELISDPVKNPFDNIDIMFRRGDSIHLDPGSVDIVFLCQTGMNIFSEEELPHAISLVDTLRKQKARGQREMVEDLYGALKPGGKLVIIDMVRTPFLREELGLPGGEVDYPFYSAVDTARVISNFEKMGFFLDKEYFIYRNEEHRKDIERFKRHPVFRVLPEGEIRALFLSEMFFLVFKKPLGQERPLSRREWR